MKHCVTRTFETEAEAAVDELTGPWSDGLSPDVLFLFCSIHHEFAGILRALRQKCSGAVLVGCTTDGEQWQGEGSTRSAVLSALETPQVRWSSTRLQGISSYRPSDAEAAAARLVQGLGLEEESLDPARHFCLMFIDGLQGMEEVVAAGMADSLPGAQLVGGSAGDGRRFERCFVFEGGRAFTDQAVLLLAEAESGFDLVKHHDFEPSGQAVAVTRVSAETARHVLEFDGLPAASRYAECLGLAVEEVTEGSLSENPLLFACRGESFLRMPIRFSRQGGVIFGCAMEEGLVLQLGVRAPLESALYRDFASRMEVHRAQSVLLTIQSSSRARQYRCGGLDGALAKAVGKFDGASFGFHSYGEQLGGLHMNQSLVGFLLSDRP